MIPAFFGESHLREHMPGKIILGCPSREMIDIVKYLFFVEKVMMYDID